MLIWKNRAELFPFIVTIFSSDFFFAGNFWESNRNGIESFQNQRPFNVPSSYSDGEIINLNIDGVN